MITKNGLIARLGFLFKSMPADDCVEIANAVLREERESGLSGEPDGIAIAKNEIGAALARGDSVASVKGMHQLDSQLGKALSELGIKDSDQWNRHDGGRSTQGINPGSQESASGGGAPKMTREYSDTAPQSGITAMYDEFNRKLSALAGVVTDLRRENEETQKSVLELVRFIGKALAGDTEDDSRRRDKAPEDDSGAEGEREASSKGVPARMPVYSVRSMLDEIGNRSRGGLAMPPQFIKAETGDSDLADHDADLSIEDSIKASVLRNRRRMAAHLPAGSAGQAAAQSGADRMAHGVSHTIAHAAGIRLN